MPSGGSEEYLARLGIDATDVQSVFDHLTTVVAQAREALPGYTTELTKVENALGKVAAAASQTSSKVTADASSATEAATKWSAYTKQLNEANAAYKAAQQQNVANGVVDKTSGLPTGAVGQQLLQIDAAQNASVIQALKDQDNGVNKLGGDLPRLRYALYDVSTTSAIFGASLLALPAIIEKTTISYDALFAAVARTLPNASASELTNLKQQLIDLTTQIPLTFSAITQIATLGSQLGVPAGQIASFTKTTAEFSATTNASVETSATAFGRLGQVLKQSDYRQLGDDIAYLGVKSVATETQIIAVAQQIGVTTTAAGYSSGQTLALAAAFSSLGVQAESARGTVSRVFNDINKAVATPGAALNNFAAISKESSADFAKQWQTDAPAAFQKFVEGLSGQGANLQTTLASFGITASRDITNIRLLADNNDVLTKTVNDLSNANGFLDASYAKVADTTQSKLTLAQNNILRLFNQIGSSAAGPVNSAVDTFNKLLDVFSKIADSPTLSGIAAIGAGVLALAGFSLIAFGALTRLAASVLAVRTAQAATSQSSSILGEVLSILNPLATRATASTEALTAATVELGDAQTVTAAKMSAASEEGSVAQSGLAASAGKSATAATGLGAAFSEAIPPLALVVGIAALTPVLSDFINQATGATQTTDQLTAKILQLANASTTAKKAGLDQLFGNDVSYGGVTTGNTAAASRFGNGTPFTQTSTSATTTISGAQAYYNSVTKGQAVPGNDQASAQLDEQVKVYTQNVKAYDAAVAALVQKGNTKAAQAAIKAFDDEAEKGGLTQKQAASLLTLTNQALGANASANSSAASAANGTADATSKAAATFQAYTASIYDAGNKAAAVQSDLNSLGAAFVNNGAAAASTGPEIQKAIADIYAQSSSGPQAAARMKELFDVLVQGGLASAEQLSGLAAVIKNLNGGKDAIPDATYNLQGLSDGFDKAATAAEKTGASAAAAAPKVYTLVNYASDLAGVFSRSQDLQFGSSAAFDKITSDFLSIKDAVSKANQTIRDSIASTRTTILQLQQTIDGLRSDNATDEYFLKIAKGYGDALRASELTTAIAANNLKIKDSQNQIATAQQNNATTIASAQETTNKTLDGNSASAIANRAQIQSLIADYSAYVDKLASSGLSQDQLKAKTAQLKQEFINQATQLGYTRSDVLQAATAFDDMTTAINGVPRNITVSVATGGRGQQALNEYIANLKSLNGSTTTHNVTTQFKSVGNPNPGPTSDQQYKQAQAKVLEGLIGYYSNQLNQPNLSQTAMQADIKLLNQYQQELHGLGSYDRGGYTGDGPLGSKAGEVHAQEFVLNPVATKLLPMDFLNSLNQGIMPQLVLPQHAPASSSNSSHSVVQFGPFERQLLMNIADSVGLSISGGAIQQAANIANANASTRRTN